MKQAALLASGALLSLACTLSAGCHVQPSGPGVGPADLRAADAGLKPDLSVSRPPHDAVEVNWKQRLDESYVYLEARGSYTGVGALLEQTHDQLLAAGLEPSGPPFALFYDDPGSVPVEELRMRACFPVSAPVNVSAPLGSANLPSTTVVYAFVGGPYPEVPRSYASLFAFMDELGWELYGPVREIYLVNPAAVTDWDQLVAEVQLPATSAR